MKPVLTHFLSELDQLEKYLLYINSVGRIFRVNITDTETTSLVEHLDQTKAILEQLPFRKVFEYNTIVVSMYGFFEKFIESILTSYLDQLSSYVPEFDKLPKAIKENHVYLTAQLMQNLKLPKYQNESISSISSKLHNCIINNKSDLNTIAFTEHSSNFRISSISEFFSRIGISGISQKIKGNIKFSEFLSERLGSAMNIHMTEDSILFSLLSDLAQRRNDISHGTNIENSILHNSIFPDYLEFLRHFSLALYEVMCDNMLEYECADGFIEAEFVAIFNHDILCLNLINSEIAIGDRIIVRSGGTENFHYDHRIVEEIQVDSKTHSFVSVDEMPTKVGLKLNGRVKRNQSFFVKNKL